MQHFLKSSTYTVWNVSNYVVLLGNKAKVAADRSLSQLQNKNDFSVQNKAKLQLPKLYIAVSVGKNSLYLNTTQENCGPQHYEIIDLRACKCF
jgi:hypothetical protein